MATPASAASPAPSLPPRRRRRLARWGRAALVGLLVGAGLYMLATQSFLTRRIVTSRLADALGGAVSASSVMVLPGGRVVIEDFSLRAPGIDGPAGQVASAERVEARIDTWSTLRGNPVVHRLQLVRPQVRISRSRDDGGVNIAALARGQGPAVRAPGQDRPLRVPQVEVSRGVIDLGEHALDGRGAPVYDSLYTLGISGSVEQSADDTGASIISFRQGAAGTGGGDGSVPPAEPFTLLGRIGRDQVSLAVSGLDLAGLESSNVPRQARDLFTQADLRGRISGAEVAYRFQGDWTAKVNLADVSVNLPIEQQPDEDEDGNPIPVPEGERGKLLRLQNTSGTLELSNVGLTGLLAGRLQGLPYDVEFTVDGLGPGSAWSCTLRSRDVMLRERPEVFKFAPGVVRRRMRDFGDPQGLVDGAVTVSRAQVADQAAPPPVRVVGSLTLKGVTAAFHKFPYPFTDITGTITFDEKSINIHELRGRGAGGSTMSASGTIAPPTEEAQVEIDVRVRGIPVDEALRQAMQARGQGEVLDAMFSRAQERRLRELGVIRAGPLPDTPGPGLDAPTFELGGPVDVAVQVTRALGKDADWDDRVQIDIPRAGFLIDAMPFPLIGTGVRIVQEDGRAVVEQGRFTGLHGGDVTLKALADFERLEHFGVFVPEVEATFQGVPADALLLAALPSVRLGPQGEGEERWLGDVLAPLTPDGQVSGSATAGVNEQGEVVYDVQATHVGSLHPQTWRHTLRGASSEQRRMDLNDVELFVRARPGLVQVRASASARHGSEDARASAAAPSEVRLELEMSREPSQPDTLRVQSPAMDLSLPVEDCIATFAPQAAVALGQLRHRLAPRGIARVDGSLVFAEATRESSIRITIDQPDGLAGRIEPGLEYVIAQDDAGVPETQGSGIVYISQGNAIPRVELTTRGTLMDAASGGVVARDAKIMGALAFPEDQPLRKDLALSLAGVQVDAPALRALLRQQGQDKAADLLRDLGAAGSCDAALVLRTQEGDAGAQPTDVVTGRITPVRLWLGGLDDTPQSGGRPRGARVTGALELRERGGVLLDGLTLTTPHWEGRAEGMVMQDALGTQLDVRVSLSASRMTPQLQQRLPSALASVMDELDLRIDGPVSLAEAPLVLRWTPAGELVQARTSGTLAIQDASANLGVRVDRASGLIDYLYELTPGATSGLLRMRCDLASFRASGIAMTSGRLTLQGDPDGSVQAPQFDAQCAGGRVAGSLEIAPAPRADLPADFVGPPLAQPRPFRLAVNASGLRFAPVLDQLRRRAGPRDAQAALNEDADPLPDSADASRGIMSGNFSLVGVLGDQRTQRGRGTLTVRGGNVLDLPTLVPLVRATNLQLPFQEQLDHAVAEFFVEGDRLGLEQLAISSESVSLFGFGQATWPGLELDIRLRTGNRSRIPLLTTIMESVRQELGAIVVTGPIDAPTVTTRTFEGARRAIDDLMGREKSLEERRLDAIERALTSSERRERQDELPAILPSARAPQLAPEQEP